jgi:uncharacterized membrane protein (DUF4010 family)
MKANGGRVDFKELLTRVGLAFGIGLLIGLERGWHTRDAAPGKRAAGVRTFAVSGLLGGIVAAIANSSGGALTVGGSILLGTAFVAFAGVITTFIRDQNRSAGTFSATTAIAALLTFILGAYALLGDVRVAAASAVATTGILVVREGLHGWLARLSLVEFESGLILLAMTFIGLPIVPDHSIGPFGGVNPREIWIIAIVLASVSFAGYLAVKVLGESRGVLLAAATGGLVSSTAVTFSSARRAATGEGTPRILAAGVALATGVSFVRVMAIIAALKPSLLPLTSPALLVSAAVASAFALVWARQGASKSNGRTAVQFRNPFGFWSVLGVAVTMGVLIVIGRLIYDKFGTSGAIAGAATMGLFDVDSMTVSMTRLVPEHLHLRGAAYAVLAGVAANSLSKAVIGTVIGRGWFAAGAAFACIGSTVAGGLTLLATLAIVDS